MNFASWLRLEEGIRYGNYCGPGPALSPTCDSLASGAPLPQPVNQLDTICQRHDIDYCKCQSSWKKRITGMGGSCSREADIRLLNQIQGLTDLGRNEKIAAGIIKRFFSTAHI